MGSLWWWKPVLGLVVVVSTLQNLFHAHKTVAVKTKKQDDGSSSPTILGQKPSKSKNLLKIETPKITPKPRPGVILATNSSTTTIPVKPISGGILPTRPLNKTEADNTKRRIFFVHVGKAGGETIRGVLKALCRFRVNLDRRNECYQPFEGRQELKLSNETVGVLHCDNHRPTQILKKGELRASITTYLWAVRDPIDRVVSWFNYMNPKNCLEKGSVGVDPDAACLLSKRLRRVPYGWAFDFYQVCFETVEDFAWSLDPSLPYDNRGTKVFYNDTSPSSSSVFRTTTNDTSCSQTAWLGLRGQAQKGESNHLHFNYQYYAKATHLMEEGAGKEILAVRTESLWEDLHEIERYIGGEQDFDSNDYQDVDHGSNRHWHKSRLSPKGAEILCCALYQAGEIGTYETIINSAKNLDAMARNQTLFSLYSKCGVTTHAEMVEKCSKGVKL